MNLNALPFPPQHVRPSRRLLGWGGGTFNQLGLGSIPELHKTASKPRRNMLIEQMITWRWFRTAGGMHNLCIDEAGTIWSFGINDEATLGRQTVGVPDPSNPEEFLNSDDLEAQPLPVQSLVDEGFRTVRVAAGDSISAAIGSTGDLRIWGSFRDSQGSIGFSAESQRQLVPIPITKLPHCASFTEKIASIKAGRDHLLMLTTHGKIYAFGNGEAGQLGRKIVRRRKMNGTILERVVLGTRTRRAVTIGTGDNNSFAVDDQDAIVHLSQKVIGLSRTELGGSQIVEISGGAHHTLFLASDGRVFACGSSVDNQLGLAPTDAGLQDRQFEAFLPHPTAISFPDNVPQEDPIHTEGGLGLGDKDQASSPTVVVRRDGSWRADEIACGGQHCLALLRRRNEM
ncbi:regulator of chromosome condensation 1/beta-lactamase-inhibitor protein II [Hygrophoropsis aurantiaca]|uniref:Regulator of chromosome condensation 1/beta-lactamase-inhibitor protein II n=1 Tax=Hygrophoropsis aurantiaca TaxID=72124 RepID=A0ACB8ACR1_9AGAM|nr:regulator of chromosome condensation 1/beta-lactamase-inhibitor protein II [Hygrophoropsis aurantiaca]